MNIALAVFVVVGFAGVLERLALPSRAQEVVACSSDCLGVLRNNALSDAEKERALQENAVQLFRLLGLLAAGSALALGLPLGIVWGVEYLGIGSFQAVLALLQRLDFLALTTLVSLLGYALVRYIRLP